MRAWFSVCQLAAVTPFAPLWLDDVFLLANQRRIMRWEEISGFELALISWKYRRNFATIYKYFCAVLYWSQNVRKLTAKDKDKKLRQQMWIQLIFCVCTETGELDHKSLSIVAGIHWTEIRKFSQYFYVVKKRSTNCSKLYKDTAEFYTLGMYPNAEKN